jgi:hypothetical protein
LSPKLPTQEILLSTFSHLYKTQQHSEDFNQIFLNKEKSEMSKRATANGGKEVAAEPRQ